MNHEPEYTGIQTLQESLEQLIVELVRAGLITIDCDETLARL
jgi:hypothetical protein